MAKGNQQSDIVEKGRTHEVLMPLLKVMLNDFRGLANKKPDGVLTKEKVALVNRLLKDTHKILEDEPSHAYLDLLNEDKMPQNSDVQLVLGQTVAAMEGFKAKYWRRGTMGDWEWTGRGRG